MELAENMDQVVELEWLKAPLIRKLDDTFEFSQNARIMTKEERIANGTDLDINYPDFFPPDSKILAARDYENTKEFEKVEKYYLKLKKAIKKLPEVPTKIKP